VKNLESRACKKLCVKMESGEKIRKYLVTVHISNIKICKSPPFGIK